METTQNAGSPCSLGFPQGAKGWSSLAWSPKYRNLCEENFRQLGKTSGQLGETSGQLGETSGQLGETSLSEVSMTSPRIQMHSVQGGSRPAVGSCFPLRQKTQRRRNRTDLDGNEIWTRTGIMRRKNA